MTKSEGQYYNTKRSIPSQATKGIVRGYERTVSNTETKWLNSIGVACQIATKREGTLSLDCSCHCCSQFRIY